MPPRKSPTPFNSHRRTVLRGGTAFLATAALGPIGCATGLRGQIKEDPFALGVASGDPWPDSVVLWTRLAPRPEQADGGMGRAPVQVRWQVAEDINFRRIVREGVETATPEWAFSVHAEAGGLAPGRDYFYRFIVPGGESPVGHTRTAPAPGSLPDMLRVVHVGCQHYETGYYTAYRHIAGEDVDVVVHTGDYIYEGAARPNHRNTVRLHQSFVCETLDQYRLRYALYKTDTDLKAAHAAHAFAPVWDDHEVRNDWNGAIDTPAFNARKAAALKAWWEHMPVRRAQMPTGAALRMYRGLAFGRLARLSLCDTRQYRTAQPCGGGTVALCGGEMDAGAQMFGAEQERWLNDRLMRTDATWNVIVQGVPMTQLDRDRDPAVARYGMDKWDGYRVPRARLLNTIAQSRVPGPISLAGDIHRHLAGELRVDFDRPEMPLVATEFVNASISSNGDGNPKSKAMRAWLRDNAHVKFAANQRGYVRHTVRPGNWQTEFQVLDYVSQPGSPIRTAKRLMVEAGRPALQTA